VKVGNTQTPEVSVGKDELRESRLNHLK